MRPTTRLSRRSATPFDRLGEPHIRALPASVRITHTMRALLPRIPRRTSLHLLPLLAASVSLACGGASEPRPDRTPGDPSLAESGVEVETAAAAHEVTETASVDGTSSGDAECVDGEWEECRVQLPKQGDVENCFVGVRLCTGGVWSRCQ